MSVGRLTKRSNTKGKVCWNRVGQDYSLAMKWHIQAPHQGYAKAIELKARLTDKITAAEVEQTQVMGEQWIKHRKQPVASRLDEERPTVD